MMTDKDSSAAGTDNRPPMLEENDYESWRICIQRYIKGKPHGKLIWKSIQNGPTPHPQTTDPAPEGDAVPPSRNKRDEEFTEDAYEDAYDPDVDEGPHASAAFMANLSSTVLRKRLRHIVFSRYTKKLLLHMCIIL
nr:hypothetical protein [Tanacetum cinerariifolium]